MLKKITNLKEMENFFRQDLPKLLGKLSDDQKALWGKMTPQHMIEHVVGSWMISNGKHNAKLVIAEDLLPRNRNFLYSEIPYKQNTENKIMGKDLVPLRKSNLDEAKDQLLKEVDTFFQFHKDNPGVKLVHPMFGELDYEGWLVFQKKHMTHHLKQFGLIE